MTNMEHPSPLKPRWGPLRCLKRVAVFYLESRAQLDNSNSNGRKHLTSGRAGSLEGSARTLEGSVKWSA